MPPSSATLLTVILTVSLSMKPASAWTFIWENATNASFIEHGTSAQPCKAIDHAQGHNFSWAPDDSTGYCLSLFRDDKCASGAGYTCAAWDKNASLTLLSFDVEVQGVSSSLASASSTSTSSSVSRATASTVTTSTSTPSSSSTGVPRKSNSARLSGGAIAGITIGSIAGVFAISGFLLFLYRRRRDGQSAGGIPPSAPPPPGGAPDGTGTMPDNAVAAGGGGIGAHDDEKKTVPGSSHSYNPQLQQHEMPGESRPTELSDAGTLHELDASTRH